MMHFSHNCLRMSRKRLRLALEPPAPVAKPYFIDITTLDCFPVTCRLPRVGTEKLVTIDGREYKWRRVSDRCLEQHRAADETIRRTFDVAYFYDVNLFGFRRYASFPRQVWPDIEPGLLPKDTPANAHVRAAWGLHIRERVSIVVKCPDLPPVASSQLAWAFHGTDEKSAMSIFHSGFDPDLCKRASYGKGSYMASTIDIAMKYGSYIVVALIGPCDEDNRIVGKVKSFEFNSFGAAVCVPKAHAADTICTVMAVIQRRV
jgi:hypothetical protein